MDEFMGRARGLTPNLTGRYALAALSGILLAVSYPDTSFYLLGWVCFVPLMVALENQSKTRSYLIGLTTGFVALSIGFYWIANWAEIAIEIAFPFSFLFVILYAFCIGQAFGMIACLYVWIKETLDWDELFVFPVAFVVLFSLFPMVFAFRLGDSQADFLTAIQPIEITGIYGLDFIMVLFNAIVFKLTNLTKRTPGRMWLGIVLIGVWFIFGGVRVYQWRHELEQWDRKYVGIVQPNRKVTLSRPKPGEGYSRNFPLEMEMSYSLSRHKQALSMIVWPEGHFFGFSYWSQVRQVFARHVRAMETPLLFYDATRRIIDDQKYFHNTILYLNRDGKLAGSYDKIKLVPFSEYAPLAGKIPLLDWIMGDYLDNLTPGKQAKVFAVDGIRVVPKICYEPLFPEFVANSIKADGAGKVILVQSQDGWFGRTSQPNQHMAAVVMRAVENRVPLIHVINNGPSAVIDPLGRYVFKTGMYEKGNWVAELPFEAKKGGSFFSRYPWLFIDGIRVVFGLYLVTALIMMWTKNNSKRR